MSRQASSPTAWPSSIARLPDTWNPPIIIGTPAARSGRAMSSARGNWFDCTPTNATKPKLPFSTNRAINLGMSMRVLVSSTASISMPIPGPSTSRAAQSAAIPYMAASVLDGIVARHQRIT